MFAMRVSLLRPSATTIATTLLRHSLLRRPHQAITPHPAAHVLNGAAMGAVMSKVPSSSRGTATSEHTPAPPIESVTLRSLPSGRLFDDVCVDIMLSAPACVMLRQRQQQQQQQQQQQKKHASFSWRAHLEIDVTNLHDSRELLSTPLQLPDDELARKGGQQMRITRDMFADAVRDTPLDTLCNVCAIHLCIYDGEGRKVLTEGDDVVIVMNVSQDTAVTDGDVSQLSRRLYGINVSDDNKNKEAM